MKLLGDFIVKQSKAMLENKQHAIMYAVVLSILPFASWLSVALVSLVTLRKGAKHGFELLLPALVCHSVPLMMLVPLDSVLLNTLVTYIPCFIAAVVLRKTQNWQLALGSLFLQVVLGCLLVQLLIPNFVLDQFNQFKTILNQLQEYKQLFDASTEGINSHILAQLFFGIQIFSVIISTSFSLMCARSIQSKLYMPGGFKNEALAFRNGRLSFLVLATVSIAAYYQIALAINLLPFVLAYSLLAGFALVFVILAPKRHVQVFILLISLVLLKPTFVLFAFMVLGALDCLFNFRLYLPAKVSESM